MCQKGEEHGTCKEIKMEPEAPHLQVCPVFWEASPLTALQAITAILAQGWDTNSGEMLKPMGRENHSFLNILGSSHSSEKLGQNRDHFYALNKKKIFSSQTTAWFLFFSLFKLHSSLCIILPFLKVPTASSHHGATAMSNAADCCGCSLGT